MESICDSVPSVDISHLLIPLPPPPPPRPTQQCIFVRHILSTQVPPTFGLLIPQKRLHFLSAYAILLPAARPKAVCPASTDVSAS